MTTYNVTLVRSASITAAERKRRLAAAYAYLLSLSDASDKPARKGEKIRR